MKKDSLGRIITDSFQDPWKERRGIARALNDIASHFTNEEVRKERERKDCDEIEKISRIIRV